MSSSRRTPRPPQLTGRLVQRGQPLANVRLRLHQTVRYAPTAADGTFATAGLPAGSWLRAETPSVPFDRETR